MRVLAIGRSEYLFEAIKRISGSHQIVAIVTGPAAPESIVTALDFESLAKDLGCGYLYAERIDDQVLSFCSKVKPDVGISVNWMSVIGESFLDIFPRGVLNAHCGDLPFYRGNAVLNWALVRGEKEIFVSVHSMMPGELDVGDVYAQRSFPIFESDDIAVLVRRVGGLIPILFDEALSNVEIGSSVRSFSDVVSRGGFRCYPRLYQDGCIDWSATAMDIDRLVKASARPYGGAYTCFLERGELKKLTVWRSRYVGASSDVGVPGHVVLNDKETGETHVYTGNGIVALQEVELSGVGVFKPGAYFKSIRLRLGLSEGVLINLLETLRDK